VPTLAVSDLESKETLENQIVTYEGKLKFENSESQRIWCFAPIWVSDGWRGVSEEVTVKGKTNMRINRSRVKG